MSEANDIKTRRVRSVVACLAGLDHAAALIHQNNEHFYRDLTTDLPIQRNVPEMISLMHSELSEMLEGVRKGGQDKHIPARGVEEVEMADLFIRALDYCAFRKLDIEGAIKDKLLYNVSRQDHTREARLAEGGKKF
jgi:hypothetical protein